MPRWLLPHKSSIIPEGRIERRGAMSLERAKKHLAESLRRFDMVYQACGSSNSAIALTPDELAVIVPKSEWVDVCKLPE